MEEIIRMREDVAYSDFLASKTLRSESSGRKILTRSIHRMLFPFQRDIVKWAVAKGRAAVFADCGLGKTLIQIEWARLVGGRCLILAPLCVGQQTIKEGEKIGVPIKAVRGPDELSDGINVANYEMLQAFLGTPLDSIVLDESSILKSIDGKTRTLLLESFTNIPHRLCCTATPCPNDIAELANHAQFLGVMSRVEMLAAFFVHDEDGWRLRGHATRPFYRWLASWCMALKKPSDIGYEDNGFELPSLTIADEVVTTDWRIPGNLFAGGLRGITDRAAVRKRSVPDRLEAAARIVRESEGQVIVWCGLNTESEKIAGMLGEDAVEVSGAHSTADKESKIMAFLSGQYRTLITKPKIAGFGMNFQNAATMVFLGMGDSYESYYQCIRRSWRFGQRSGVKVYIVVTDHEQEIVVNVRRKETEANTMMDEIVTAAKEYEMAELGKRDVTEVVEDGEYSGANWRLIQGDSVEKLGSLKSESIDLSIFSPPFSSLYTYSATERDLGNSKNHAQFFEHFGYVIDGLMRVTKPGRLVCCHVSQLATTLTTHGVIGLYDFRADTTRAFVNKGFVYHGEVCIDKDPQAQAIRTHSKGLLFVQLRKDASWLRPAMADYILVFRKPGDNAEAIHPDLTNNEWIEWARPIWYGIKESDTLNRAEARSNEDDRHICALQLGTIERCVRLWSNQGDTVLSPFAGIGSEGYVSVIHGRKFVGIELKPLYAKVAASNLRDAESKSSRQTLFG